MARRIDRVVIDPGHGGVLDGVYQTPGKRYTFADAHPWTVYEGERMRVLGGYLAAELVLRGVEVVSSLTGRVVGEGWVPIADDVPRPVRVRHVNALPPAGTLCLPLHSNAVSNTVYGAGQTKARGVSVYTSRGETGSDPIATALHGGLGRMRVMPMRSQSYEDGDPDYEAGFDMVKRTRCRATLLELGFHDNRDDARLLMSDDFLAAAAEVLAEVIANYGDT